MRPHAVSTVPSAAVTCLLCDSHRRAVTGARGAGGVPPGCSLCSRRSGGDPGRGAGASPPPGRCQELGVRVASPPGALRTAVALAASSGENVTGTIEGRALHAAARTWADVGTYGASPMRVQDVRRLPRERAELQGRRWTEPNPTPTHRLRGVRRLGTQNSRSTGRHLLSSDVPSTASSPTPWTGSGLSDESCVRLGRLLRPRLLIRPGGRVLSCRM